MSENRIISQCAPTLAGIKTGSLFPHPYDSKEQVYKDIREINRRLIPKGLCLIPLRFTEKNVLLYLYRRIVQDGERFVWRERAVPALETAE